MHSTRLTVPAADPYEDPNVETRPAKLREWVDRLPYASRDGVIEAVIRSISLLNRYPGTVGARAELMECYRIPCSQLFRMTPTQIGAPSFEQLRQLVVEMTYGFKHVTNECLLQKKSWLSNRKKLASGVYFAIKYLSLDLLMGYECYQCKAEHNWRELLPLYALAEQQNLHAIEISDPDQPNPENATVSHLMKRVVLLSLVDPCQMQPGEARTGYDYLNLNASLARLESLSGQTDVAGRFLLDMEGLRPARPYDPDDIPSDSNRYRLLNVIPVSKQAHKHLRQIEFDSSPPPGGLQLVRDVDAIQMLGRMLKAWHARQERGSPREDTFGWVVIAKGVSTVHRFLQSTGLNESFSVGKPASDMVPNLKGPRCRRLNVSKSGIALRLRLPSDPVIAVGQLLIMQDDTDLGQRKFTTGIVRRCLRIDDNTLELGIQYLRGQVHPVSCRPVVPDRRDNSGHMDGLYISEGENQLGSLVVARGLYQEGREFLIEEANPAPLVTAVRLIESGTDFDHFFIHSPQSDWDF